MLKLRYSYTPGEFQRGMQRIADPMADAATAAIRDVGDDARAGIRAAMAAAHFSRRFQNATRLETYPRRPQVSLSAAALIFSKIPYAGVFAEGAIISGSPLWVRMSHAPARIGRFRTTAERLGIELGKPLVTIRNRRGQRFLAAPVPAGRGGRAPRRVSLAALRRGASMRGGTVMVPLFVAKQSVTIPKKFDVEGPVRQATAALPAAYARHLDPEMRRR